MAKTLGVPSEVKDGERRVALDPHAVAMLTGAGPKVLVECGARARAPIVVDVIQVRSMRKRSLIVDLAIDQGGCVETSRPTSLSSPVYEEGGIIHYCVTNVPGQFPRTASRALRRQSLRGYANSLLRPITQCSMARSILRTVASFTASLPPRSTHLHPPSRRGRSV